MIRWSLPLAVVFLLGACVSGDNYPEAYASNYCTSLFQCVDEDDIDDFYGYDTVKECREDRVDGFHDSGTWDAWEEGDCDFDADAAEACLDEVVGMSKDNDCDGNMSILSFEFDAWDDDCGRVYDCN